jgi:hypothetical protein
MHLPEDSSQTNPVGRNARFERNRLLRKRQRFGQAVLTQNKCSKQVVGGSEIGARGDRLAQIVFHLRIKSFCTSAMDREVGTEITRQVILWIKRNCLRNRRQSFAALPIEEFRQGQILIGERQVRVQSDCIGKKRLLGIRNAPSR